MYSVVALLQAMQQHRVPLDVTDSGPLPGMFVLAAHNDAAVRQLVADNVLCKLGPLDASLFDEGHDQWGMLVDSWVCFDYMLRMLACFPPDVHKMKRYKSLFVTTISCRTAHTGVASCLAYPEAFARQ